MKPVFIIAIAVIFTVGIGLSINVAAEEKLVPAWIKNTAEWWVNGDIGDGEFLKAIEYLVKNNVIQVSQETNSVEDNISGYATYVNEYDGYMIKVPDSWITSDYNFEEDSIEIFNPLNEKGYELLSISVIRNSGWTEIDDYVEDSVLPSFERGVTDFVIVDERWTNDENRFAVPYGYEMEFTARQGIYDLENGSKFFLKDGDIWTIHYTATQGASTINLQYVFDSFQVGKQYNYGGGYFFDISESEEQLASTAFDFPCSDGWSEIRYSTSSPIVRDMDTNKNGVYCQKMNSDGEVVYRDDK